jgi:hypothetical protein
MSISSNSRKAGPYSGNDVATAFSFAFKVFTTADVLVVHTSAIDVETELSLGPDYTVTLNSNQDSNPGGTVTLPAALVTGTKLTITSALSNLQPVTLTNNGGFYPAVINDALDRATILIQQLAEEVGRAVKVNISSAATPDEFLDTLSTAAAEAEASAIVASDAAAAAAASAASIDVSNMLETADIGATVQAYDVDTAKTDVAQTWVATQRTQETTDNDGSFDLNAALDFECTPTAGFTLTFTNIPASPNVQRGSILLVNGSNYAVAAHANTKVTSALLTTISATGTFLVAYETRNGLAYVTSAGAFA